MLKASMTKEQLRQLVDALYAHEEAENMESALENTILQELDLRVKDLLNALVSGNTEEIMLAFTGWTIQTLLAKAGIIPDTRGILLSDTDIEPVFPTLPWEVA